MKETKNELLSNGIAYHLFTLDEPMDEALQLFMKQRTYLL